MISSKQKKKFELISSLVGYEVIMFLSDIKIEVRGIITKDLPPFRFLFKSQDLKYPISCINKRFVVWIQVVSQLPLDLKQQGVSV